MAGPGLVTTDTPLGSNDVSALLVISLVGALEDKYWRQRLKVTARLAEQIAAMLEQ